MPINAHPDYIAAEKIYLEAKNDGERQTALEDMIRKCPSHKGAENLRAQLRLRLKKLKEKIIQAKKSGKSTKQSIRKSDMQAVLIGVANSGKSTILAKLTNAHPKISEHKFTTQKPEIGILNYQGIQIQIIDLPSIGHENFDIGIVNTADLILETITDIKEIEKIEKHLSNFHGKKLIVFNKTDLLIENQKRKISENLKSKRRNFILCSMVKDENIGELKEKIFNNFEIVRIYLKEPGKELADKPMIMKPKSTIKDISEKISSQFAKTIKDVHIWGPSSKFPNQKVGLNHKVKDKDIVEFKTH